MDQVLFATYAHDVFNDRRRAEQHGCGLEIHLFSEPAVLGSPSLTEKTAAYRQQLAGFPGPLGLHGAFYDMASGSIDPQVAALTRRRYRQSIEIAIALNVEYVVFHANYIGSFRLTNYRAGWHERQVAFWQTFLAEDVPPGLTILLENMWSDDPTIICDVLAEVNQPNFRACLDVAHATLYSPHPITEWLETLQPYLYCCHLNNHDGELDLHWPLPTGVIDYQTVLGQLRRLPRPPLLTLELPDWKSIAASLPLLEREK